jgi:hypothetical protein
MRQKFKLASLAVLVASVGPFGISKRMDRRQQPRRPKLVPGGHSLAPLSAEGQ